MRAPGNRVREKKAVFRSLLILFYSGFRLNKDSFWRGKENNQRGNLNYLQRCSSLLLKGLFPSHQMTPNLEWHFLAPLQHQLLER